MAHKERLRSESGVGGGGGLDVAGKGVKPTELRREKEGTVSTSVNSFHIITSVRSVHSTDLWGPG